MTGPCPSGKTEHPSETAARRAATSVGQRRTHDRPRVYQCPHCHGWHLTSSPKARQPAAHGNRRRGNAPAPPTPATRTEFEAWFAAHTPNTSEEQR
ncbi:hypothetical protein [Blastococcus sp. CT_GayMR16]|uniref:hypothetical protein n=1 Tax=Blastococcus sp. CT_GayMR16 TaxID=2559607 RepID=UPI0010737A47|nr:hypothetical protein [Blastococcus sp. CT_GayMR16]TFV91384.1 hypothetical protein E4P38_02010 [Blastococcus sp. CT_GayMR16]